MNVTGNISFYQSVLQAIGDETPPTHQRNLLLKIVGNNYTGMVSHVKQLKYLSATIVSVTLIYIAFYPIKVGPFGFFLIAQDDAKLSRVTALIDMNVRILPSYGNLERMLCDKSPDHSSHATNQHGKKSCPTRGIVSMFAGGRTGNRIWEYASIWAVARETGLQPYIPQCLNVLASVFENLTLPQLNNIALCPVKFRTFVNSPSAWTSINQSIIIPHFAFETQLVLKWIQEIIREFQFKNALRKHAQKSLTKLIRQLPPQNYTFVGVHVRRTDYALFLKRKYNANPAKVDFYSNAMAYYKAKYPNCLFIFVSDDPEWCFGQFGKLPDVFVPAYGTKTSPAQDLALMGACNHSIFDYGTFGVWGSILAQGDTVYSNISANIGKRTWAGLKNWIPLD